MTGTLDALDLGSGAQFGGTIEGFNSSDSINLAGITVDGTAFSNGVLTIDIDGGGNPITLDFTGSYTGDTFVYSNAAGGGATITLSVPPCYCPGTLILTPCGEVAVESLAIGDWVITHSGQAEPIKWIGRRRYSGRFIEGKPHILPICIRENALAEGSPRRDLWVSPQHALYLEGALVPASELVNGISITQEPVEQLEYIHIELASHALIWAEGAAAETFVDDNSRQLFENAEEYALLYPDEEPVPAQFCAERLADCYEVEAIRWRLADRAQVLWPTSASKAA